MPFREKMKRAFGRPQNDDGSDLTHASSKSSKKQKAEQPDNVYKFGEPMPKPKYRGPYNKEHQEKLSSFSFSDAWKSRRKSDNSMYSPLGSRLPSQVGSLKSRKSRKSLGGPRSRQQSHVEGMVVENADGDDDVMNVGLSRQHTLDENTRPRTDGSTTTKVNGLESAKTITHDYLNRGDVDHGKPFTEEDLTHALTMTTLKPSASDNR